MYLVTCGALLSLAAVLNLTDRRMLVLILAVGINIFFPVPAFTQAQFYGTCIALELMVLVVAVFYSARASSVSVFACVLLIITHFMGWTLDGSQPFSPYQLIVKFLEVIQLLACVALSPVFTPILRNHDVTT